MKVCIAGKNNIAVECAAFLISDFPEVGLIACPNTSDGGIDTWQLSFKKFCRTNNIPLVALEGLFDITELVFISLEFDRLLKPEKFKTDRLFNIHFSKLPAYRGCLTSIHPILNNEIETGVTLHVIDDGIDSGPIIEQQTFAIPPGATSLDLYKLYTAYGTALFKRSLRSLINNTFKSTPQLPENSSYYSRKSIDFSFLNINLNKTAQDVHNWVRAMAFEPYQLPVYNNCTVKNCKILPTPANNLPGLFEETGRYFICNTMDYQVLLEKS